MPSLTENVRRFCELLERGEPLAAMERYYADDICVFENRELARAGREQCLAYERDSLSQAREPPKFKVHRWAVNDSAQVAFLEYTVRFTPASGRPMRLEEVAVQTWHGERIGQERFYYVGLVDEGDEGGALDP
ncbi:MAG: nuclear transport factor 2 family protein [Polyangiaceae bacterium]